MRASMKTGLALVALSAVGAWVPAACTFPDVSFEGAGGGAATSTSSSSGGGTGPSAGGGGQGGSAQGGAGQGGAGGIGVGGAGGGEPVDPCDVDGDGIPSAKPGCENAVGGGGQGGAGGVQYDCDDDDDGFEGDYPGCAGTDCYDANAEANPDQEDYFIEDRGDGSFDYDCNGVPEQLFAEGTCICSGINCTLCSQTQGFVGDVGCGQEGQLANCSGILGNCTPTGASVPTEQQCR